MPGALSLRFVVTKLTPVSSVPMPEICNDHKSLSTPTSGETTAGAGSEAP